MNQHEPAFTILAHDTAFVFSLKDRDAAWYAFDHASAVCNGKTLLLNADREVYASLKEPDGQVFYGIIGEDEDDSIPDNFPIDPGTVYRFYDHPETEEFYL